MSLFQKFQFFIASNFSSYDAYSLNPLDEVVIDTIHVDPAHFDIVFEGPVSRLEKDRDRTGP
jgi:hypothetical protein